IAGVACMCALFRAGMFIHEIQHMRRGEMVAFKIGWNLLYGMPMALPSFMYANHPDHHDRRTYGTRHDSEYAGFGAAPLSGIVGLFTFAFVAPLGVIARFLVLAPIPLLWPKLRHWVICHATTLGDAAVARRVRPDEPHRLWAILELVV